MNDIDKRYQETFQIGVTPEMLGAKNEQSKRSVSTNQTQ